MSEDPMMRAFKGGSLSWSGERDVEVSFARSACGVVIGFLLALTLVLGVWALGEVQSQGEHPEFTCDPGAVYTVAECP